MGDGILSPAGAAEVSTIVGHISFQGGAGSMRSSQSAISQSD